MYKLGFLSRFKGTLTFCSVGLLILGSPNALAVNRFLPIPIPDGATTLIARDVSADGSTVVGQIDDEAFVWSEATGLLRLGLGSGNSTSNAHSVSADGSIVVGSFADPSGRDQPYRWSAAGGLEPLVAAPGERDSGVALGVSADGSTVVGTYGTLPLIEDSATGIGPISDTGTMTAFQWRAATGLQSLGTLGERHGSQATAVSADGSRVVGNDFDYFSGEFPTIFCSATVNFNCPLLRDTKTTFVAQAGVLTARAVQPGSAPTKISANGETIVGSSPLIGPFSEDAANGERFLSANRPGRAARDLSADGSVIGGDFGVWLEGRAVILSNLLSSSAGLSTTGWKINPFDSLNVSLDLLGGPGITGISDDGLTWVGTGENPQGLIQPFVVQLDSLPTVAQLDAITPFAFSFTGTAQSPLFSAALPHSRVATVGSTVTFSASMLNFGSGTATGCEVISAGSLPLDLSYQQTNPVDNAPIGTPNTPFEIPPDSVTSLVLSATPTGEFPFQPLELRYDCANTQSVEPIAAINDVQLAAGSTPAADILALSTTMSEDGVVQLGNDGTGAFAVATRNVSTVTDTIVVAASALGDFGSTLVELCETNTATGACLATPTEFVVVSMAPDQTRSFGVFVTGSTGLRRAIPDFVGRRIVVNFSDGDGVQRGRTSVAFASAAFFR